MSVAEERNRFEVRGWCPGALRPMASGDGLVVRVRPRAGRLSPAQACAIAEGAGSHGNGLIDLTSRANVQIRGVSEASHGPLLAALSDVGLIDTDVAAETRRNIMVTPFGSADERAEIIGIAARLEALLAECGLPLPGKFGFAVDCGTGRVLAEAPADIRIERDCEGGLLVRADGAPLGYPVRSKTAPEKALELAAWFLASGGAPEGRGRMARHLAAGAILPEAFEAVAPAAIATPPSPGRVAEGVLVGVSFGQLGAGTLGDLAARGCEIRVTPWRMLLLVGVAELPSHPDLIVEAGDPGLRVTACTGAPGCPQANAETRGLAASLAAHLPPGKGLHVSGCEKSCASTAAFDFTLTAAPEGFQLVRDGQPSDPPLRAGLKATDICADPALVFET